MADAVVRLETVAFGLKPEPPPPDPHIEALVEQWRLARRAGDRERARALAKKVEQARRRQAARKKER